VDCQLSDDDQARPILSCKFIVSEGMNISQLAPELVGCLRTRLGLTKNANANETETTPVTVTDQLTDTSNQ
jgi:hypothetical protein